MAKHYRIQTWYIQPPARVYIWAWVGPVMAYFGPIRNLQPLVPTRTN